MQTAPLYGSARTSGIAGPAAATTKTQAMDENKRRCIVVAFIVLDSLTTLCGSVLINVKTYEISKSSVAPGLNCKDSIYIECKMWFFKYISI